MRLGHFRKSALTCAGVVGLSACGGGGGGGTNFIPPPPGTPTVAAPPVTIFNTPQVGTFVSAGASKAGARFFENSTTRDTRFSGISGAAGDQPQIRYTPDGHYEVTFPSRDWSVLVQDTQGRSDPLTIDNPSFQSADGGGKVIIYSSRKNGYNYSELAAWSSATLDRAGTFAFGPGTPAAAVPLTGSATYNGTVSGTTDIFTSDLLAGGYSNWDVRGSVILSFDFARGNLAGSMSLSLNDSLPSTQLGSWQFKDTVFSAGSTTYSGQFDTPSSGQNFFMGHFTGPNAEETIGGWALPFVFSHGDSAVAPDGQVHQAIGAWIAKKAP
jgi:hypothetical protein